MRADTPIQYVKGVGPARAKAFEALGVRTARDVLEHYPFRYEESLGEVPIDELRAGAIATIRGEATEVGGRWPTFQVTVQDETGACRLRWFNRPRGGFGINRGATVIATGKVQEYNDALELVQPTIRTLLPDAALPERDAQIQLLGVYNSNEGIKSGQIRQVVDRVLQAIDADVLAEFLPPHVLESASLMSREVAVRTIHRPSNAAEAERARHRLAYEEFFLVELAMAIRRQRRTTLEQGIRMQVTAEIDRRIRARFPFALTAAQDDALREIVRDLHSGRPMTRLLQGDVGSGKTVVALYSCLAAIASRHQAAIMAPTEILAAQHADKLNRYLANSRVRTLLLRGGLPRKERAAALQRIEHGTVDLVVGTQALIQKDVAFRNLGLVVVDEQHKFGVLQRADIRTKGSRPHYLVMTATPIPRTLSMTLFGDLDISVIDAAPPGRGRVKTDVVRPAQLRSLLPKIRRRLLDGEQAYVVCPLVVGGQTATPPPTGNATDRQPERKHRPQSTPAARSALLSAVQVHERLSTGVWHDLNLGLLHGGMKRAEKDAAIGAFGSGHLHALISTTVVEVGVDVPDATLMIVENAERFGLSQLHQLRGRIGRGGKDGHCYLVARGGKRQSADRLAVMTETTDGFRIAEEDLRQRGPGELLGTRQHGMPELRIGRLVEDTEILAQARAAAFALIEQDPALSDPAHEALRRELRRLFKDRLNLIDAA